MLTATADRELIEAVAAEMAAGIDCAVEFWMHQIDAVLEDSRLTTLGRLQGVQQILRSYRLFRAGADPAGSGHAA
jgi:hypothetical protein